MKQRQTTTEATPYRSAEIVEPAVDRGPSLLARFGAVMLPRFVGARWRWWRKATGGRWAREWGRTFNRWFWREWPRCPTRDANVSYNAGDSECAQTGECRCEVWP